ncbi:MAG: rhodanese-like domain-containing protein [Candidatus Sericytochromatia bacterium]|nr:rhodanese-like domain-containing protein [Candidatus Sericytochromatia bacterium]
MLDWLLGKRSGDGMHASTLPAKLAEAAPPQVLDVREPSEWAAGHIPGARHVPLGQLPERWRELPTDRPLAVICRSGARSARAVAFLRDQGLAAHNVEGGMLAWPGPVAHD